MDYTISRLGADHIDSMRELMNIFAEAFEDRQTYAANTASDAYLATFLNDDNHIVLVATNGNRVLGGLVAYVLPKYEMERKEIYIYDIAVSNVFQRKGIGRGLIGQLKVISHDVGAYLVFVQADEGDDAIKFYESLHPDENMRARSFDFLT